MPQVAVPLIPADAAPDEPWRKKTRGSIFCFGRGEARDCREREQVEQVPPVPPVSAIVERADTSANTAHRRLTDRDGVVPKSRFDELRAVLAALVP